MSAVKERILGAVTVMSDIEAEKIWDMITKHFSFDWDSVETVSPDEWDKKMLAEIKEDPDCKSFVSSEEAMKAIGLM
ncbi:MAG: hypothetical protein J1E83_08905 [Lachnospiraceae bacterium]|nr:hypothetical protein [Lachnospiraceae bacterium]